MCVVNPEGLKKLLLPENVKIIKEQFDILVVDESTKFKNTSTQRFKYLKQIIRMFRRRYLLTGTFTPQGLLDLFGQIYILDEGAALGAYITHYRTKYFVSDYMGYSWTPQPTAAKDIAAKIAPLTLVMEREGNIELPELLPPNDIYVDLPKEARDKYKQMEDAMVLAMSQDTVIAANAAVASSKCRQIANGFVFTNAGTGEWIDLHDEKIDALVDLVDQLSGEPLLVAYEFRPDLEKLKKAFPKALHLTSGNARKDDAAIQAFRTGNHTVALGQFTSISLGIDGLQTACSNIAMYGLTWDLQSYLQTIDRIWRSGNPSKVVSLHRIVARDTVDEKVLGVLQSKDAKQTDFINLLKGISNANRRNT
jgi:SNF2 family DNA or RNA helicase